MSGTYFAEIVFSQIDGGAIRIFEAVIRKAGFS